MKRRNARVFAMFMSSMLTFTSMAPATVYAAEGDAVVEAEAVEETAEEAEEATEEVAEEATEEVAEEATEEVVEEAAEEVAEEAAEEAAEKATEEETEEAAETEDVENVENSGSILDSGFCGDGEDLQKVTWNLYEDGDLVINALGDYKMADYTEDAPAPWYEKGELITKVTINGHLQNIGDFAFFDLENLVSVRMRQSVTEIGDYSFLNCTKLTKLEYLTTESAQVETYGVGAFMNCISLEEIPLTSFLQFISPFAFYNCEKLKSGRNESGVLTDTFKFEGSIQGIGMAAFWGCKSIAKLEFPSSITFIDGGYVNAGVLEDLPECVQEQFGKALTGTDAHGATMTAIGKLGAFTGCTGLEDVTFKVNNASGGKKGLHYIGHFAFYGCTKLSDVTLVETLGEVGDYAFADCTGMTEVVIDNSGVDELHGTFKGCTNLGTVTLGTWVDFPVDESGHTGFVDEMTGEEILGGYRSNIESIGYKAFENCRNLENIKYTPAISDVDYIGKNAFFNCAKLEEIPLPYFLNQIDDAAFQNCTSLKYVAIPNHTTRVGANAFYNDKALDHVYFPVSLTEVGMSAFDDVDGIEYLRLVDVYYQGSSNQWKSTFLPGVQTGNEILVYEGTQYSYKTNKYFNSNIAVSVPKNVKVSYSEGMLTISWDQVELYNVDDGEYYSPDHYEVYQNHNGSSTIDQQWANGKTPAWGGMKIVDGTDNSWTYNIGTTLTEGDIYHFKVRAVYDDFGGGMLSDNDSNSTYKVQTSQGAVKVDSISFEKATYDLTVGDVLDLTLIETSNTGNAPTEELTYTWKASDTSVVGLTANSKTGSVNAKAAGTSTITVTGRDGLTATITVNVKAKSDIPVESVTLDKTSVNVAVNGTVTLTATINPNNADRGIMDWKSSNNDAVSVVKSDNEVTAIVTGLRVGDTATITATTNNGTGKSATCVVTVVESAEEPVPAFVERMYNICLDRPSDPEGKEGWVNNLKTGNMDGAGIAKSFVFSQEMINKNLDNEEFVKTLYRCMMGREADAAGLAGWVTQLSTNTMSRSEVAKAFVASPEFDGICASYGIANGTFDASDAPVEKFVNRFYQLCLQRDADSTGLYGWVNNLKAGTMDGAAISKAFFFSQEMNDRGLNDSDFVELLYTTMMGRASDSEGKGGWLAQLANGSMTRMDILAAFVTSPEFTGICDNYGIVRGTL